MLVLRGSDERSLSRAHLRYLLLEQGVGSAVVNLGINGAIAWAVFRSLATVPLWGQPSIAGDTLVTGFALPFLTCLIVTPLVRRDVRRGRVVPLERRRVEPSARLRVPRTTLGRALALGAISVALAAVPAVWGLNALEVSEMRFVHFLVFKAAFAAGLAAAVTPPIALGALHDAAT